MENAKAFLRNYCVDCHTVDDPSGEREFETLDLGKDHLDTQLKLQEIIDQLTLGAMPPEDADQPDTKDKLSTITHLTEMLSDMRDRTASTGGQTVLRRLTRREYRNTVGDLLEKYLDATDRCVEKALAPQASSKPQEWGFHGGFVQQNELKGAHRHAFDNRYMVLYNDPLNDKPEGAYGPLPDFFAGVPADGIYEVKVLAQALHRDTPYTQETVFIDLEESFRMGIRAGNTAIGEWKTNPPAQTISRVAGGPFREWLRAIQGEGSEPRSNFDYAAKLTEIILLGVLATDPESALHEAQTRAHRAPQPHA